MKLPKVKSIDFKEAIEDLSAFIETVFTPKPPYFLFALTIRLQEDYYKVKGVDLLHNKKYTVEITPHWARAYTKK